jgi:hypothetical protein
MKEIRMKEDFLENRFLPLPVEYNSEGKLRHAGFEFEYANVKLPLVAAALQREYGGTIEMINPYHYKVNGTKYGTFKVMIDFQFLVNSELKKWVQKIGLDGILDEETIELIEKFIATVGESVVPYEVTTPPIPHNALYEAQKVKEILRELGAKGTKANPIYAFGMHINPELRAVDVSTILSDLRAFFVLYEYLVEWLKPDLTRRITPYINPFDREYRLLVLTEEYNPTLETFIDDYLRYNPTRNRALDLLPLLTWIDEEKVRSVLPDEKIGKRPTYHYRLPDSRVDEEEWCVCDGWNSWVLVEQLSLDEEARKALTPIVIEYLASPLSILLKKKLIEKVEEWVEKSLLS